MFMATRLLHRSERLKEIEGLLLRRVGGMRAVEIAEVCGVDRRTVYRDLSLLNELGVPVYQKDGRFFLDREHYGATVQLNLHEIVALSHIANMAWQVGQHSPYIVSVLTKLAEQLPVAVAAHLRNLVEVLQRQPVDRASISILETLTRAWAEQVRVKVWYRSGANGIDTIREFATYFIEPGIGGSLYLVGLDYMTQKIVPLRLQQVRRVQALKSSYRMPSHLQQVRASLSKESVPSDIPTEKTGEVVLIFSANVMPLIDQKMRRLAQKMTVLQDQRGVLSLRVADWHEILPWVRSWGIEVEVLRPKALREQVAAEAARMAAVYGRK